jgi:hypothetical protein
MATIDVHGTHLCVFEISGSGDMKNCSYMAHTDICDELLCLLCGPPSVVVVIGYSTLSTVLTSS